MYPVRKSSRSTVGNEPDRARRRRGHRPLSKQSLRGPEGIVNLTGADRTDALWSQIAQATVTTFQVAKERALNIR